MGLNLKVNQNWEGSWVLSCAILSLPFSFSTFLFLAPNCFVLLGRQQTMWDIIGIDEREATEFVLVDGTDNFMVNGSQDGVFLGEFTIKIQSVSSVFL